MNTSEAKGRTGPSPDACMGNVEALKERPRLNTLFDRIKRWKNLFILRLDKPVWVKAPDRNKMLSNNGNQMLGQPGFAVGASRGPAGGDIVTVSIQPN